MGYQMLFKTSLLSIFLTGLTPLSPALADGGSNGGGGQGVVCRNADGSIKSVELLDLWEARILYGRNAIDDGSSVERLVKKHIPELAKSLAQSQKVNASFNQVHVTDPLEYATKSLAFESRLFLKDYSNVKYLSGVSLAKTKDTYELIVPDKASGCKIEQIVNYRDQQGSAMVLVNKDLKEKMDTVNQAALLLHEIYYRSLRALSGDTNSIRARRAIGIVMSGGSFEYINDYLDQQKVYVTCQTPGITSRAPTVVHFTKVQKSDEFSEGARAVIERVNGVYLVGSKYSFTPGYQPQPFENILNFSNGNSFWVYGNNSESDLDPDLNAKALLTAEDGVLVGYAKLINTSSRQIPVVNDDFRDNGEKLNCEIIRK